MWLFQGWKEHYSLAKNRQRPKTQLRHSKAWFVLSVKLSSGEMNAGATFMYLGDCTSLWPFLWKPAALAKFISFPIFQRQNTGIHLWLLFTFIQPMLVRNMLTYSLHMHIQEEYMHMSCKSVQVYVNQYKICIQINICKCIVLVLLWQTIVTWAPF